jgi:hypothetical protein
MRDLFDAVLVFLSTFFIVYLMGVFCEVSFDISTWYRGTRLTVVVMGTFLGFNIFQIYKVERR